MKIHEDTKDNQASLKKTHFRLQTIMNHAYFLSELLKEMYSLKVFLF